MADSQIPPFTIQYYLISSVMHAFWLVLTYDLLEDRRIDDVIIYFFKILYYIKKIDSKLPCVCSVIDHRGRQNVVRTSVTHSAAPRVPLFCSYHILMSAVIYHWTDAQQLGIYLLIIIMIYPFGYYTICFKVTAQYFCFSKFCFHERGKKRREKNTSKKLRNRSAVMI